jgi:hypothetical protein
MRFLTPRVSCLVLIAVLALLGGARSNVPERDRDLPEMGVSSPLTAERARQALIAMLEGMSPEEQDFFQLAELRANKGMLILDDQKEMFYRGGEWNCHLRNRTFLFPGPIRPHGCTRTEYGEFKRVAGTWQARVTGRQWACRK